MLQPTLPTDGLRIIREGPLFQHMNAHYMVNMKEALVTVVSLEYFRAPFGDGLESLVSI